MTPQRERLVARAATAGAIAFAAAIALTAGSILWPRVASALGVKTAPIAPAYAVGSAIDVPMDWHTGAPYTLVLFARNSCGACQTAAPYLKDLVAHLATRRAATVFVGAGPEIEDNARYARALGIADSSIRQPPRRVRARVTPTLVLVNRQGIVLGAWEGVGPEAKRQEITASLDGLIK